MDDDTNGMNGETPRGTLPKRDEVRRWSNRNVVLACLAGLAAMGAMSYAAVPLYRIFCQTTGYGGTPTRAEKLPDHIVDRIITVRFDANVVPGMPWEFAPEQRTVDVKVGESTLAFFRAHNTSDQAVTGQASFNVTPDVAGAYFSKIQCFCFTEQTLDAGQSVDMPVSFFIDPSIMKDRDADQVRDITLSYTFYPIAGKSGAKAEIQPEVRRQGG
jgi:cytochrome c oxidase assembly protein subunit 11